jgi:Rrf2 family protein
MHIARKSASGAVAPAAAIAESEQISVKFLEAILGDLKAAGFVVSKKGIGGGYQLNHQANALMLSDLIRATNGPIALVPCVSLNYYEPCDICPDESQCGLHDVMQQVRDASLAILSTTSIQDLITREDARRKKKSKR